MTQKHFFYLLLIGLFILLNLPSRAYAIFRGFPAGSEQKRTTTTRFIIKFNDWSNPNVEMVNSVNESLGITTMRPLFTDRSVGIPVAYKPTSINLTNNQVIEKFSLYSKIEKILAKFKLNRPVAYAQGNIAIGSVFCADPGQPIIPIPGATIRIDGIVNAPPNVAGWQNRPVAIDGQTDNSGVFTVGSFPWPISPITALQSGWWKPNIRVLSLPATLPPQITNPNFRNQIPVATNCSTGINGACRNPTNVCSADNSFYQQCNLQNQNLYLMINNVNFRYTNCRSTCDQPCQQNVCGPDSICDVNVNICKIADCLGQPCTCALPPLPSPLPPFPPPPTPVNEVFISPDLQHFYVITLPPGSNLTMGDIINAYSVIPEFESVEPDHPLHDLLTPNDNYYSDQWSLDKLDMEAAWDAATASAQTEVKIAVIDSGIDQNHEDLQGLTFYQGRDYADCEEFDENDSCLSEKSCPQKDKGYCADTVVDDNGHGTHVAGIMSAGINNITGTAGIVNKVGIIPVKVLNSKGDTFESWTWEGIVYGVNQGAKVMNLSIGGCASLSSKEGKCTHESSQASKGFKKVLDYTLKRNVVVVVAAGNENDDAQWYMPPNYNNTPGTAGKVIVVGSTGPNDERSFFSNYGKLVDLGAPGGNISNDNDRNSDGQVETEDCLPQDCILSPVRAGSGGRFSDRNYESYMGTSMAAPHVTGLAALLRSLYPDLSYPHVTSIIISSADPITTDLPIGGKRINAKKAVEVANNASMLYAAPECDLCGWCDPDVNPKPPDWEKCYNCLYNPDGTEKELAHFTVFGCFQGETEKEFAPQVVKTALSVVFGISAGIGFLVFLYGSILLITSRAVPQKIKLAKELVFSSVAGLMFILFSTLVLRWLGVDILQIPGFG